MAQKLSLSEIEEKVDSLNMRERVLVLLMMLAGVYFIWYLVINGLLLGDDAQIEKNIKTTKDSITSLKTEIDADEQLISANSTASLKKKIDSMKQENQGLQEKITNKTRVMIGPQEMTRIIKEMINKSQGITVDSMESLGTTPLLETKKEKMENQNQNTEGDENKANLKAALLPKENKSTGFQIYDHPLKIVLNGSYFDILKFLESVEDLHLHMLWGRLDYEVKKYPVAQITIIVHTISLEQGWIRA